jgi:hypothetical protein
MNWRTNTLVKKLLGSKDRAADVFGSRDYRRHNQRRLEHLASLGLEMADSSVLEVGAGVGDHTSFFLDRGCRVVSTDARPENVKALGSRYPAIEVRHLDLDSPDALGASFDIVYCYGLLYHLTRPAEAIEFMDGCCRRLLLVETCVSFGDGESVNPCAEPAAVASQSVSGRGCRPTRPWVYGQLRRHFEHVYMPTTQPYHEQFPVDWTTAPPPNTLTRAVFIASRQELANELLVEGIPMQQTRR